ncbi:MAG: type II toxin-antitoxin system HicA family toxin [Holophagales bacterium]|jgi:predicted RNA binding protein YcfA (HicA-like mRNA interferase family)|nr:type II toxin-antitoxin system HicA family toxin [Holophagales bacterium]
MNFKELERIIKTDDWKLDRVEGSHFSTNIQSKKALPQSPNILETYPNIL